MRTIAVAALLLVSCAAASVHRGRGETAAARGRTDEATVELELAVAEQPADARAWAALGRVLLAGGRPGGALRAFDRAARLGLEAPERAALRAARAGAACRPDAAALAALRSAALSRDLAIADRLARAYVDAEVPTSCRAGEVFDTFYPLSPAHALPWAELLIADAPDASGPHLLAARALASLGDAPRALIELTHAEALADRRGPASIDLAAVLVAHGRPIDAITAARQAVALAGPGDRPAALAALAAACRAAGRDDDAARVEAAE